MQHFTTRRLITFLSLLLAITPVCTVHGQSGRKIPKREPDPPPVTQPDVPPPSTAPPSHAETPKIPISAAKYTSSFNIPPEIGDYVLSECTHDLRDSGMCDITSGMDMNRKEAIDAAKGSTQTYYLWIEISSGTVRGDMGGFGQTDLHDLVATYVLFEPGTAKIHTQGKVYVNAYNTMHGTGHVMGPIVAGGSGFSPEEAGQKAAHAVLDSFGSKSSGTPTIHLR